MMRLLLSLLLLLQQCCYSFQVFHHYAAREKRPLSSRALLAENNFWQGVVNLWDEVIEVSTYGPSERKMMKAKRDEATKAAQSNNSGEEDLSVDNFRNVVNQQRSTSDDSSESEQSSSENIEFDGYAMRDLLVEKWGIPLDIDFQRMPGAVIYCTVMPVAFGSRKCQHENELSYLMHLQGVVEILHKYNNLDLFIEFIMTTSKVPKTGTDSVPFRLELSEKDLETILGTIL